MTGNHDENGRDARAEAEALAAFTDALLDEGAEAPDADLDPALTETVRVLGRTLRPETAPARLRARLRRAIRTHRPEPDAPARGWPALRRFLTGARLRPARMALAALVVVALAAVLVVASGDVELAATASGEVGALLWVLGAGAAVAVVVAAVLWWRSSR